MHMSFFVFILRQIQYGILLSSELYEYPALNLDDRFNNRATNITKMGLYVTNTPRALTRQCDFVSHAGPDYTYTGVSAKHPEFSRPKLALLRESGSARRKMLPTRPLCVCRRLSPLCHRAKHSDAHLAARVFGTPPRSQKKRDFAARFSGCL